MLTLLTYLSAVLIIAYYSLYFYFRRNFNYWKKRNVDGPKPVTFFGNIKESALRRKHIALLCQDIYNMFPKEKVVGIYRMTTPCLFIRDLDTIKHIMIKNFHLFTDRGIDFGKDGLGQNMFHADGETWSALRARFSPIFTSGKIKSMFYLINECGDMLINYLNTSGLNLLEHDIRSLFQRYTISSISTCAFGINFNYFEAEMDETLVTLDKTAVSMNFTMELDMMYPGLLKKLNISIYPANVINFFDQLVRTVMSQRNGKPSGRGDFMDLILQLREMGEVSKLRATGVGDDKCIEISNGVLAAQAFIFFVAGFETSSSTMANLLYQLALNPEIQDKLREEIDSVTKAHELAQGEITYESLKDMKYLDKIFLETLRMYPILDPLQRKAKADYKIPGTDVTLKKDQIVLVPVLGIHYDKNYYPKPEVFDPERFEPNVAAGRHPCAYLPFGVGPRNCIGMRFGSVQSRLGIAKIISRFIVEPTENTRTSFNLMPNRITLVSSEEIFLAVKPRIFN